MPGLTKVVCFGFVVADRVYEVPALPCGDGKVTATAYRETGGGIGGTAAVAVAALGGHAVFCGSVGDDAAGGYLREAMARHGVDLAGLHVEPGARTPGACVIVDPRGERSLVVDRGTVRGRAPDPALLAGAGAVLVDHRFPSLAAALLREAPGVPSVLDAEGGDAAALRMLASVVRYPVFSRNGLLVVVGEGEPEAGLRRVDAPGAVAVGVTLGAEGSLWRVGGAIRHVPAPRVEVRDTTGCGDVFHGAFALAVAEGAGALEAARFASAAAACKARNGAGWEGMAGRAEVGAVSTWHGAG